MKGEKDMFEIKDLSFSYSKKDFTLKSISLNLSKNCINVLFGKNGCGKSTMLKCVMGLLKVKEGIVNIDEEDFLSLSQVKKARLVSYLPQEIASSNLSVMNTLLLGRLPYQGRLTNDENLKKIETVSKELHIEELLDKNIDELSIGQRQKVMIAKALVQESKYILLDEPTSSLDIQNQAKVLSLLKQLCDDKRINVLLSMHDINLGLKYGKRFFCMKDGQIIFDGYKEDISEQALRETFETNLRLKQDGEQKFVLLGE